MVSLASAHSEFTTPRRMYADIAIPLQLYQEMYASVPPPTRYTSSTRATRAIRVVQLVLATRKASV